jgi:hypothetical protein
LWLARAPGFQIQENGVAELDLFLSINCVDKKQINASALATDGSRSATLHSSMHWSACTSSRAPGDDEGEDGVSIPS